MTKQQKSKIDTLMDLNSNTASDIIWRLGVLYNQTFSFGDEISLLEKSVHYFGTFFLDVREAESQNDIVVIFDACNHIQRLLDSWKTILSANFSNNEIDCIIELTEKQILRVN